MSVNEELREHSEHAHDDFSRKAGGSMAIIAAVLAVVAVYGHLTTTEELLMQEKASDQWAFYQAKALRRYQSEVARDLIQIMPGEAAAKTAEKYGANLERYQKEAEEIQEKAKEYGQESEIAGRKALRLHVGEIFLELAIVFSSLAILARRSLFWVTGIGSAIIGVLASATVFLIRH
jgi:ABC-type Zn uptake system ZnuABC Zn-binding protein ZnuA